MLSNLASYFLGFGSAAGPEEQENLRVTASQAEEEDWLVVEAVPGSRARSRSSSLDSAVEESWFVTPPPCFTSSGPVSVETSPLENLLIEHPSMSVYRRVGPAAASSESPAGTEGAAAPQQPSPADSRGSQAVAVAPPRQPLRSANTPAAIAQAAAAQQTALLKRAQKVQIVKENQTMKPKYLERGNKTREVNKRNKKLRRADRQLNHSGANNNRKCC